MEFVLQTCYRSRLGGRAGDRLVMKDWYEGGKRIEWLEFADGQAIRIGDFHSFIVGTAGDDSIVGTQGRDFAVGGIAAANDNCATVLAA